MKTAFRELKEETGLTEESVGLVDGGSGPLRFVATRYPMSDDGSISKVVLGNVLGIVWLTVFL